MCAVLLSIVSQSDQSSNFKENNIEKLESIHVIFKRLDYMYSSRTQISGAITIRSNSHGY